MSDKTISTVNGFLSKVDNFKYFVLVGTFTMMLDTAFIYAKGVSLLDVNWNYINTSTTIGDVLVFLCLFSLFITFVSSTLIYIIRTIYFSLPSGVWVFFNPSTDRNHPYKNDYISVDRLRSNAIKNNNNVAYMAANEKCLETSSTEQLERYSFSFLIASFINWIIGNNDIESIIMPFFIFSEKSDLFSFDTTKAILTTILYISVSYLGVVRGCGIVKNSIYEDRIYIENHNMNDDSNISAG